MPYNYITHRHVRRSPTPMFLRSFMLRVQASVHFAYVVVISILAGAHSSFNLSPSLERSRPHANPARRVVSEIVPERHESHGFAMRSSDIVVGAHQVQTSLCS